jgi:hypothetical protein
MSRGVQEVQPRRKVSGDLEQYRRLVELQKQMIKVAKQNEKTKRECAALREKAALRIVAPSKRRSLSQRLRQKARKVLRALPELAILQALR